MMKLKRIQVLLGVLALIAATPLAVDAKPPAAQLHQMARQVDSPRRFAGVKLTPQQQQQLSQIRRENRAAIERILTPQQRQQLKALMRSGKKRKAAIAQINLTPQQQTQLQQVRKSARSRTQELFTPQQRQKMRQNIRLRRQQVRSHSNTIR